MSEKVQIITNTGKKVLVSREFSKAFQKAKHYSKSLGKDFGEFNDIPSEEFSDDFKEDKPIKKGEHTQWL